MPSKSTTREAKALDLIQSGAVSIFPGREYATVKGSGKATYQVNRDGCTCPDFTRRGGPCKHQLSVKAICTGIRLLREQAAQTGRVTLPANIGRALHNAAVAQRQQAAALDDILFTPSDLGNLGATS